MQSLNSLFLKPSLGSFVCRLEMFSLDLLSFENPLLFASRYLGVIDFG